MNVHAIVPSHQGHPPFRLCHCGRWMHASGKGPRICQCPHCGYRRFL